MRTLSAEPIGFGVFWHECCLHVDRTVWLTNEQRRRWELTVTTEFIKKRLDLRTIAVSLLVCLRDDRGATTAEYLMTVGITVPLICFLFHPDNGFYQAARNQYNLTTLILQFPGP